MRPSCSNPMKVVMAIGVAMGAAALIIIVLVHFDPFGQDGPGFERKHVVGGEPLHYAVVDGDLAEVTRLVEQNADVNAREDGGRSPLHFAAGNGFLAIAGLLLAAGAEVNAISEGYTPLDAAIIEGHENVAHLLRLSGGGCSREC